MTKNIYGNFLKRPSEAPSKLIAAVFATISFFAVAGGAFAQEAKERIPESDYYYDLGPGNAFFLETWTDTSRINADDNWLSVFSIFGYYGDYSIANPVGVNPQTILTDLTGARKVTANQSNPDTLIPEGIAEFDGIADPVVALKGGPLADAPHLDIRMNTMGCNNTKTINFSYRVRDIDGSANNAVSQIATQYRIGDTGNYIDLPFGYVADATTGPNLATKVTTVFVSMPNSILLQPKVHFRIMTTNSAGGADEWVGIDDISVRCVAPTGSSVSLGGRVSSASGAGIKGVKVSVFGANMEHPAYTTTGPMGKYAFEGLQVGENYVVTVLSSRYQFEIANRLVDLTDAKSDIDFIADPQ